MVGRTRSLSVCPRLCMGPSVLLAHTSFLSCGACTKDINQNVSVGTAKAAEEQYFRTHKVYSTLQGRAGTGIACLGHLHWIGKSLFYHHVATSSHLLHFTTTLFTHLPSSWPFFLIFVTPYHPCHSFLPFPVYAQRSSPRRSTSCSCTTSEIVYPICVTVSRHCSVSRCARVHF